MNNRQYTVHLVDSRVEKFDSIVVTKTWIRCTRDGPTPRVNLPKETKYYPIGDVEQIKRIDG